jgi:hypothetical protein
LRQSTGLSLSSLHTGLHKRFCFASVRLKISRKPIGNQSEFY